MTRKEAIEILEDGAWWDGLDPNMSDADEGPLHEAMAEYVDKSSVVALIEEKQRALCPVGRFGRGYVYGTDRETFDAWQEIIDAIDAIQTVEDDRMPPNPPLTLEELREMDGKPVYILSGDFADWRIPDFIDEGAYKGFIRFTDRSAEPMDDYGKAWLAYRKKPEEGAK